MHGKHFTLFFVLVGILAPSSLAEDKPCTVHGDGKYYDLNSLRTKEDYEMKTPGGQKLYLNVCGGVHTENFGLKDAEHPSGFVRRGHRDFSIGTVNKTLSLTESGPRITLTNGSLCKTSSDVVIERMRASSVIDFICDMGAFGTGKPRLVVQLPPNDEDAACAFYFEWKTHYACPTSDGSSAWGFFTVLAVLLLVLAAAYTVLGTLYNRFVLQLRGFDQIPQFSLESTRYHAYEAIDWFRDVMSNMYENSQSAGGRSGDVPFRRPGGSANAPNPFSHFSQTNNGNEFIRPRTNRPEPTRINPVSHHNQAQVETAINTPPNPRPSAPPHPPLKDAPKVDKDIMQNSTSEEKQFMLTDDDDEAGQEMDVVGTSSQSPQVKPPSDSSV